jgi:hypothetical protein
MMPAGQSIPGQGLGQMNIHRPVTRELIRESQHHGLSVLVLFVLAAFLGLSSCGPLITGTPLSTETIIEEQFSRYQDARLGLTIIARADEVADIESLLSSDALSQLRSVDYNMYFVVVAFQGQKPGAGYSIHIERITRADGEIRVYTRLKDPSPFVGTPGVVTSPYHAVKVIKHDSQGKEFSFELVVAGTVVTSVLHDIP